MIKNLFFADENKNLIITYDDLINHINDLKLNKLLAQKEVYKIIINIYASLLADKEIILFDPDFDNLDYSEIEDNLTEGIVFNNLLQKEKIANWRIGLFTSGTTGKPKLIFHNFHTISRNVKIDKKRQTDIWGFTYNPSHIAGVQLLLQAFFNRNPIINLYKYSPKEIIETIKKYRINSLSATPTFYRMISDINVIFPEMRNITLGGEKTDNLLINKLKIIFPNSRIRNIYASTEAGTILISNSEIFEVINGYEDYVKIIDNTLYIKSNLLGKYYDSNLNINYDEWFNTGDIVNVISDIPLKFKFISRKDDIINVGGEKVNLIEIEEIIRNLDGINNVRVYSQSNSITGNILCADIILSYNSDLTENILKKELKKHLNNYKIPRIINFVNDLLLTKSQKVKRIE